MSTDLFLIFQEGITFHLLPLCILHCFLTTNHITELLTSHIRHAESPALLSSVSTPDLQIHNSFFWQRSFVYSVFALKSSFPLCLHNSTKALNHSSHLFYFPWFFCSMLCLHWAASSVECRLCLMVLIVQSPAHHRSNRGIIRDRMISIVYKVLFQDSVSSPR